MYKNQIIKNRLLVFLCKYLFRLNKNLEIRDTNATIETSQKTEPSTSSTTSTTTTTTSVCEKIPISKKYLSVLQDLFKHSLIVLDIWSQSFSSEFYNQVAFYRTLK